MEVDNDALMATLLKSMHYQNRIFSFIVAERGRQERLKAEGKFLYTCADPQMLSADKYVVLGEEFGELGRAILNMQGLATDYKGSLDEVEKELIQIAAVSVAWLEFIQGLLHPIQGSETVPPTEEGQRPPDLSASLE